MRGLPYYYEDEHVRVVHAAMVPGIPLAAQREEVLCGSTRGEELLRERFGERYWHELYDDAKPIVFGHHVVGPEPLIRDGRVFGIDTGACHGMRLTALRVPGFQLYSVAARADHWTEVKRTWQVPVLRTRSWATMSWQKLDRELGKWSELDDPEARRYLDGIRRWADDLRASIPRLEARVGVVVGELRDAHGEEGFARAAAAHLAKPLLFSFTRGRLTADAMWSHCYSPARTIELATALGCADLLPDGDTLG
jgi:serine/threonine protein phosphatase 1